MKKGMVQKLLAVTMTVALIGGCIGCGSTGTDDAAQSSETETTQEADASSNEEGETASDEVDESLSVSNEVETVDTSYANSAKVKHESLIIAIDSDPGNMLPLDQNQSGKDEVCDMVFERLYVIDGFGGDLLPCIASELPVEAGVDETSGDHMYDITIRDNVYDSEGNHITASDVAYSYEWLVTNSTPQNMGKYHSAEAVDDYTVRFYCDELDGVSDENSLFAQQWVFSEAAQKAHDFATDPIGTGPYVMKELVASSTYAFEARDDYWAEGEDYQINTANVQSVTYKIMGEASQHANALKTGEIDFSKSVPETDRAAFTNGGEYEDQYNVFAYLENMTCYMAANCDSSSVCNDVNLRKAIYYAIDGNTAAQASGNASAEVTYDIFNSKFPETKESWKTADDYYGNPSLDKAKEYLEQSNYNGETLVLLASNAPSSIQNVATVAATVLQSIGINVELSVVDSSICNSTMEDPSAWDLTISFMAADDYGVVNIARLLSTGSYSEERGTVNFIHDDKLQELVDLCNSAEGHTDENVQELHDYIIENAYARGLFAAKSYNIVSKDVTKLAMTYKYNIKPGNCIFADNEF